VYLLLLQACGESRDIHFFVLQLECNLAELNTWKVNISTEMHQPVTEQGIWIIRTSQELRELCKDIDVMADVRRGRFEWFGHVIQMGQIGMVCLH
jgi:hypothetical protein